MMKNDKNFRVKSDKSNICIDRILLALVKGKHTITTISQETGMAVGNVHRTLATMIEKGLAFKESPTKQYFSTQEGRAKVIKILEFGATNDKKTRPEGDGDKRLRGHKLGVLVKIKKKPKEWDRQRKEILIKKHMGFTTTNLNNCKLISHTLDEWTLKTMRHAIMFYPPKRKTIHPYEYWTSITPEILAFKNKIERFYGIILSEKIEIFSNEIADEKSSFAQLVNEDIMQNDEGFWTYHDPIDAVGRFQIDRSKGFREWDALDPRLADTDVHRLMERDRDYCEHETIPLPSDQAITVEQYGFEIQDLKNIVGRTAANLDRYAEEISTHGDLNRQISTGIQQLGNVLERIEKRLSNSTFKRAWALIQRYLRKFDVIDKKEKKGV